MKSRMARYTMLNSMRQGGGNSRGEMRGEGGNMRGEMRNEGRNEGRNEMRGGYGQSEMRGGMEMGYGEMRGGMEMGYGEMRGGMENRGEMYGRGEMRNGYGGEMRNEGGNYARDNYGVDNRFRDRRGREHYDNGRYAPMRNDMGRMGGGDYGAENRRGGSGGNYGAESRGGREGEMRRGGGRSEMNWGEDEEEGRMNQIGFDRPQEMQSHYPSRIDYNSRNEFERGSSPKMAGGAKAMEMELDKETAEQWVGSMKNADGTQGEHWRIDQVKAIMSQKAIDRNIYEVYAVMNAMYSDYGKVLKKRGVTTPDVYLEMALAFLDDPDAVAGKAAAYYEHIVKH